jgi:hypothetical protein
MTTRARVEGDRVVMEGRKQFVSFVDNNAYTLTYCRFGTSGKPSDIGAVIVPHDAPGFSHSKGSVNMADELLFGRLTEGGRLTVDIDDKDEVLLDITPNPKKESRASRSEPTEPEEATAD